MATSHTSPLHHPHIWLRLACLGMLLASYPHHHAWARTLKDQSSNTVSTSARGSNYSGLRSTSGSSRAEGQAQSTSKSSTYGTGREK